MKEGEAIVGIALHTRTNWKYIMCPRRLLQRRAVETCGSATEKHLELHQALIFYLSIPPIPLVHRPFPCAVQIMITLRHEHTERPCYLTSSQARATIIQTSTPSSRSVQPTSGCDSKKLGMSRDVTDNAITANTRYPNSNVSGCRIFDQQQANLID